MGDQLRYYNNKLLLIDNRLALCCCDTQSDFYWEGIPCEMTLPYREVCKEWDQCQYEKRVFFHAGSLCLGNTNRICECQRLQVDGWTNILNGHYTGILDIQWTTSVPDTTEINWTDTEVTVITTGYVTGIPVSSNTLISDIFLSLTTISPFWNPTININVGHLFNAPARIVAPDSGIYLFTNDTASWDSKDSHLILSWGGKLSNPVYFDPDAEIFASGLQAELRNNLVGNDDVDVIVNSGWVEYYFFGTKEDKRLFEISFHGSLCGIEYNNILVNDMLFVPSGASPSVVATGIYGDYILNSYLALGSESEYNYLGNSGICPYENAITYPGGPSWFVSGLECCPQRGTVLGPNQTNRLEVIAGISGYCYNGCSNQDPFSVFRWSNLDNIVWVPTGSEGGSGCYAVSPYYFLFGMEGRFEFDHWFNRNLFIKPDCDFATNCQDEIPCNCYPELFIAQFHKDVPWGPFGAYYPDIYNDTHLAWTEPYNNSNNPAGGPSYLSLTFATRFGADYAPEGTIKTIGTWLETKKIVVRASVHRPISFYVGTGAYDDLDFFIEIDPTTVSSDFTWNYGGTPGCSYVEFTFDTSGKTVGDFLNGINAIKIDDWHCNLFAFCPASSGAKTISASKIINNSADLFEQEYATDILGLSSVPGGDGPDSDSSLYSGSDIIGGLLSYEDMFGGCSSVSIGCDANRTRYNLFVPTTIYVPMWMTPTGTAVASEAIPPPMCRLYDNKLPKESGDTSEYYDVSRNTHAWWSSIQGCRNSVIHIKPNTQALDPFSVLNISVVSGIIYVVGSGTTTGVVEEPFSRSGIINTNKNEEYTVGDCIDDLNNLTFNYIGVGTYNPLIATTGVGATGFIIWLDDVTFRNTSSQAVYTSGVGYSHTTYNFSYKEPLLDKTPVNILGASTTLESWIRRRCGWTELGGSTEHDPKLPPCIFPNAVIYENGIEVDCDSDEVVSVNWLSRVGCDSYICKTEWYIRAERCPCNTVYRCDGINGRVIPHPVNHNDQSNANYYVEDYAFNQPTLYVCQHNFHPECNIPMMVKVPFQIIHVPTQTVVGYQDGDDNLPWSDLKCLFCNEQTPCHPFDSLFFGWCQVIDPTGGTLVKEEDIPRESIPTAYIIPRSWGVFCSTHVWNFDPHLTQFGTLPNIILRTNTYQNGAVSPSFHHQIPEGCLASPNGTNCFGLAGGVCGSCDNWDNIVGAMPVDSNGPNKNYALKVLFRPALFPVTFADICGTPHTECDYRVDVSCGTVCCECFYTCNPGDGCYDQYVTDPFTQDITYDRSVTITNNVQPCVLGDLGPLCNFQICVCFVQGNCLPPCWGVLYDYTEETHVDVFQNSCNCVAEGNTVQTYTVVFDGCPNTPISGACWSYNNPCNIISPAPQWCGDVVTTTYDCNNYPTLVADNLCCGTPCTGIEVRRPDSGVGCMGSTTSFQEYADYYIEICKTVNSGNCEAVEASHSRTQRYIASGISPFDGKQLGHSDCEGGIFEFINEWLDEANLVINNKIWTSCTIQEIVVPMSYSGIRSWITTASGYLCGIQQIFVASGDIVNDPRFLGSNTC